MGLGVCSPVAGCLASGVGVLGPVASTAASHRDTQAQST